MRRRARAVLRPARTRYVIEHECRGRESAGLFLRILLEAPREAACVIDAGRSRGSADQSGSPRRTAASVSVTSSPSNARLPVSIS